MQERYEPAAVERAAQQYWDSHGSFEAREDASRTKYYCLSMFPYPSGRLHMGHVRNYTIGDVLARFMRMQGHNVLQPMGWDAFGLPAENAAIANGVPPARWTRDNIAYMRAQLRSLGFAIDWKRELATCDPDYYRWNQWLFLRMLERGIAFKRTGIVNWDPVDQTVLANEQVIDGRGWRTGALVEKREIPMYYLRITDYADELLAALDQLPGWPERVRVMQANWLGRSQGVELEFPYAEDTRALVGTDGALKVFTTRADTLYGVSFVAISAEHPLATAAAAANPTLAAFVAQCRQGSTMEVDVATAEKRGMDTGLNLRHPLTGERVPLWVANYVLMAYGEGAVMGVPAHDERDFAFAQRYALPIRTVVRPADGAYERVGSEWRAQYSDYGVLTDSGEYSGLESGARHRCHRRGARGARPRTQARAVAAARLGYFAPALLGLPDPADPLRAAAARCRCRTQTCRWCCRKTWCRTAAAIPWRSWPNSSTAPARAAVLRRDAKPTPWILSSIRPGTSCATPALTSSSGPVDERARYWMPVDQYIGGIEHAILHLLYSRFWTRVMRDLGLVSVDEPFANLLTQGMVLNQIYFRTGAEAAASTSIRPKWSRRFDRGRRAQSAPCRWSTAARWNTAASAPCRNRRTTASIRRRWWRNTAPTRRACSPCSRRRRSSRWNGPTRARRGNSASCGGCGRRSTSTPPRTARRASICGSRRCRALGSRARAAPRRAPGARQGDGRYRSPAHLQYRHRRGHGAAECRGPVFRARRSARTPCATRRSRSRC